jgi:hypothetical protein
MRFLGLVLLAACASETRPSGGGAPVPVAPAPPVLPVLAVDAPPRAAFLGAGPVEVAGRGVAGDAPLTRLTVNGVEQPLGADGSFAAAQPLGPGLHIFGVRLEDAAGERAVDGRAVIVGEVREPGVSIPGAAWVQLGPALLDDDAPDRDDVAGIAEAVLADPALAGALVGVPLPTSMAVITPTAASWGAVAVDLVPGDGVLAAELSLAGLQVDVDVDDIIGYEWLSTTATAWADAVELSLVLQPAGGARVEVTEVEAAVDGFAVAVDWFPDFLEDDLAIWLEDSVQQAIVDEAGPRVAALLSDFLAGFAVDTTFETGISLSAEVAEVALAPEGLRFSVDVAFSGPVGIALPVGAGSLRTPGPAPAFPAGAPFTVLADDDTVNQLLFAFWASGAMSGLRFDEAGLIALAGANLPPPLGPVQALSLDLGLPPVLSPPTVAGQDADLSLGELRIGFLRTDGAETDVSASVRTGGTVGFDAAGALALSLDQRPAQMVLEVGVVQSPPGLDPGDIAALVRLLVPPLLAGAGAALPAFEAPTVDLGAVSGLDALAGVELGLASPALRVDAGGWIVLEGDFVPVD